MTQTECATYIGKSRDKVAHWTRTGFMPSLRDPDSGRPMYPRAAVDAWLVSFAADLRSAS